jgi:hypothetical protein
MTGGRGGEGEGKGEEGKGEGMEKGWRSKSQLLIGGFVRKNWEPGS